MLGIESSCDDTAVAVLRTSDGAVLGHAVANQVSPLPFAKPLQGTTDYSAPHKTGPMDSLKATHPLLSFHRTCHLTSGIVQVDIHAPWEGFVVLNKRGELWNHTLLQSNNLYPSFKRPLMCRGMQVDIHAPWGGVVPSLASEAHKQAMEGVVEDALRQAGLREQQLDAVAVTIGPGLSLCLKVRLPLASFCP